MFFVYLGILLISTATLSFEIALTRVFSVSQWYHFAFMSVSIALLGFGASGSFLAVFRRVAYVPTDRLLTVLAGLFSLSSFGSYLVVNEVPFDSFRIAWEPIQALYLALQYLALATPFFFSGLCVGVLLDRLPGKANTIYFFNLVGSGVGCLLVIATLPVLGGAGAIVFTALLGAVATAILGFCHLRAVATLALAAAVGIALLLTNLPAALDIKMSPYKGLSQALRYPGARIVATQWNAFSRVDLIESAGIRSAPGLSFVYPNPPPPQMAVAVDGEDLSPITQARPAEAEFTEYLPTSLAYRLGRGQKVLIIEPQGGLDVLAALHHEASSVAVVMSNPAVVTMVRDRYADRAGGILDDPRVEVIIDGARSYLRRSGRQFDIVQVSLSDTFRVVTAGAYSLQENYLYTEEAFREYYDHLAPGGLLVVTRWLQMPPSEVVRALALAVAALEKAGVARPGEQVVALRSLLTGTLLVKKGGFTAEEVAEVWQFSRERQFDIIYLPGVQATDVNQYNIMEPDVYYESFQKILSSDSRGQFYKEYAYDVTAPLDDKPFFFHFFRWRQLPEILRNLGKMWQPFGGGGYLVTAGLLLFALVASTVLILVPLLLQRGAPTSRGWTRWRLLGYFAALGIGYLFVEIPLMQKFILLLGQPTYTFAVVLFTILVSSGIGSLVSGRRSGILLYLLAALVLLAVAYPLLLPFFFQMLLGQDLAVRVIASVGVLTPLGLLMGVPFPAGIRIAGRLMPEAVAWLWGVNGCASVVSAVLSAMVALAAGFSWVLIGAGIAYGLAFLAIYPLARSRQWEEVV